jgi:hypothetical protein
MCLFCSNNEPALKNKISRLESEVETLTEQKKYREDEIKRKDLDHAGEIKTLKQDHVLALKEKEFEMKHFKDEELKGLHDKIVVLEKEKAVLEKENKMLDKIVDLNGDIVDVKELINQLIKKIPTMDLKSLTINNTGK